MNHVSPRIEEKKSGSLVEGDMNDSFHRNRPGESSSSAMSDYMSPTISYLLHSNISRNPSHTLRKRGFSARDGPINRNYPYSTADDMEKPTVPTSPLTFNHPYEAGADNNQMKEDTIAFQDLTIQSPVISYSPISSFSSFTPSRTA